MISTRRVVAVLGLAAAVTGLAAPPANAAEASAPKTGQTNPVAVPDSLTVSDVPAGHEAQIPRTSAQMRAMDRLGRTNRLGELHRHTDLVAPVTGLLPAAEA